jgi:hypothetical protein
VGLNGVLLLKLFLNIYMVPLIVTYATESPERYKLSMPQDKKDTLCNEAVGTG